MSTSRLVGHCSSRSRPPWAAALLMAAAALSTSCSSGGERSTSRPNLVLIVVDTLRGDAVFDGTGSIAYPELRRLSRDGIAYERCFSHSPLTRPSHTALFSSRLPHETGVHGQSDPVSEDLPLLTRWLRDHGYRTAGSVSIRAVGSGTGEGLDQGFELFRWGKGGLSWTSETFPHLEEAIAFAAEEPPFFVFGHFADPHHPYRSHGPPTRTVEVHVEGERVATVFPERAERWSHEIVLPPGGSISVTLRSDTPFVMPEAKVRGGLDWSFEHGDVRTPLESAELRVRNDEQRPRRAELYLWIASPADFSTAPKLYAGEIEHFDSYLGRLLDLLEALDVYDDSIVVFTSDHGEGLGEHGVLQHAVNLYEEALHVPLVIKPARGDKSLRRRLDAHRDRLVRHIDLVPTMLDLLALPPLPGQRGTSLLRKPGSGANLLLAQAYEPFAPQDQFSVRDDRFKLIYFRTDDRFELYDLRRDPDERNDVFEASWKERPSWPDQLRAIADSVADGGSLPENPEVLEELRALGYLGD